MNNANIAAAVTAYIAANRAGGNMDEADIALDAVMVAEGVYPADSQAYFAVEGDTLSVTESHETDEINHLTFVGA